MSDVATKKERGPKVYNEFYVEAVPTGAGTYNAAWAAPGFIADWVYNGDEVAEYDYMDEAEDAARRVMFAALNSRYSRDPQTGNRVEGKNVRHVRPTGPEFAAMLAAADISPIEISTLCGAQHASTGLDWIDGRKEVPFYMWWAIPLLADPKNLEIARKLAEPHTVDKPRKPKEPSHDLEG